MPSAPCRPGGGYSSWSEPINTAHRVPRSTGNSIAQSEGEGKNGNPLLRAFPKSGGAAQKQCQGTLEMSTVVATR